VIFEFPVAPRRAGCVGFQKETLDPAERRVTLAPRRTDIDLTELGKLCQLQCTDEEISAWFGGSTRTIERRRLEPKFAEVMERGKAKGRISVRHLQIKMLEEGNATMGVWLGK